MTVCVVCVFNLDITAHVRALVEIVKARYVGVIVKVNSYGYLSSHSLSLFRYHFVIIQDRPRPAERMRDIAILVIGKSPVYYLVGWMPVVMAMQPRYRVAWDNNYWVPQANLFEMKYLKRSEYGDSTL